MKCELCGSNRRDSIKYGEFLTKNGKGVHTNCLYLSSAIVQNGQDEEGILGFLPNDIAAEKKRVSTVKCCYCGQKMANIGCCEKRCRNTFHMICGIENGAMNQFIDTFRSFCHLHVRKVNYRPKKDDECCICYEKIFNESTRFNAVNMIRAPCCRNGWFHKYCLQQFAKNAGYFFKCPLCNDNKQFKQKMSLWGIFVQNKDAEWELVPNAYAELLERPSACAAETCQNAKGRTQHQNSNPFLYCVTCGSVAMHRQCMPHKSHSFECDNCKSILQADSGRESMSSQAIYVGQPDDAESDAENSDVDVCGSTSEEEEDCDEIKRQYIEKRNSLQKPQLTAAICSDDESVADIAKEKIEAINFLECRSECKDLDVNTLTLDASVNNSESQCNEKKDQLNVSCIAQRTRRKSVINHSNLPAIEDQESTDDNESTSSYKSSNCFQVFEYDEGEAVTEEECSTEPTNLKTSNSLDTSCIANRTRRRYYNKNEGEVKSVCQEHYAEHNSIGSHKSYQSHQGSGIFENSDTQNLKPKSEEQISYGDLRDSSLMNYFFKLLNEVKCNSEMKNKHTKNNNDEKVDENDVKSGILNTSCIANRTRRRLNSVNTNAAIPEIYTKNEGVKVEANNTSGNSSQESYESTTYFGHTIEHQNAAENIFNCHETDNASKVKKIVSRKRSHSGVTEELKNDSTTSVPLKIPAIAYNKNNYDECVNNGNNKCLKTVSFEQCVQVKDEMNIEGQENILEQSCIAKRTRRKSMDVNHLNKLAGIASRKKRFMSVDEQTLSNCMSRALTPHNMQPSASYSNNTLTTSAIRRGQRRRLPPRRLIESDDVFGAHKSMLGHSPNAKYANWSNIQETTCAYISHSKKLKSALKESAQQPSHIPAAQTHFARSYQLLLECNENHYAGTSSSAQRV